jgi:hypothetical protein
MLKASSSTPHEHTFTPKKQSSPLAKHSKNSKDLKQKIAIYIKITRLVAMKPPCTNDLIFSFQ